MTRKNAVQEIAIMALLLCLVAVVYIETMGGAPAAPGQLPPSAFPRIAAGVVAALACLRIAVILFARPAAQSTRIWPLRTFALPAALSAMMVVYFLLFDLVPFAVLTGAFLLVSFTLMGVRPVGKILLASAVGAAALYLLFAQILSIAV